MTKDNLAPENHNSEQDDAMSQAHNVAKQARDHANAVAGATESVKPQDNTPLPSSEQDTVDRMRDMDISGKIDMNAYAGEPNHDDNVGKFREEKRPEDSPASYS